MKALVSKLKLLWTKAQAFFPSAVPIGRTAFDVWADSIIQPWGFPDNESLRFALASMVMHLGPTDAFKPRWYFVKTLRTAMAKQVASTVFVEIKEKQQAAEAKAARDKITQAEATATTAAASNGHAV